MAIALYKVDEDLWTRIKRGGDLVMDMNAGVYHLLGISFEDVCNILQLSLCNDLFRFLGPLLTPDNNALVEKCWILRAVCCESRMLAIKRNHNREVLLHSAHKELEKSPIFILVPHFIGKLLQERLKFFRREKAWDLT